MKEKRLNAANIVDYVYEETQGLLNEPLSDKNELEITAILVGLAAFYIAGFKNDYELCQELTPDYQKRIMPYVTKDEYDYYTNLLNYSYVQFREAAIKLETKTDTWTDQIQSEYTGILIDLLNCEPSDRSKEVLSSVSKDIFGFVCGSGKKNSMGRQGVDGIKKNDKTTIIGLMLLRRFGLWLLSGLLILAVIILAILLVQTKSESSQNKDSLNEYKAKYASLKKSYDDSQNKLNSVTADNNTLKKNNDNLTSQLKNASKPKQDEYSNFGLYIGSTGTSNRIASVASRVYAVKRGSTDIIKIKWLAEGTTLYMGSGDTSIVDAQWEGENIKITGVRKGVTTLKFGSDTAVSKDRFIVVLVCYD